MSWFVAVGILIFSLWTIIKESDNGGIRAPRLVKFSFLTFLIVTTFYVIGFPIYYFLNDENGICIDNYSEYEVDIYIDGNIWIKNVPSSTNLSYNSLENRFYEIEEGNHSFEIRNRGRKLQEGSLSINDDDKYILNVLGKVTYKDGRVGYGSDAFGTYSKEHKKTFFMLKKRYDYIFESPPKSMYVRSYKASSKKYYIVRSQVHYNQGL